MNDNLKLLAVLAHPDDESLGNGGVLAKYADEGVEVYLVTATRGERGWFGRPEDYPGPAALGEIRERELLEAADILGIREVSFLDYRDGELDAGRIYRPGVQGRRQTHAVARRSQVTGLVGHAGAPR